MTTFQALQQYARQVIAAHPELTHAVADFLELARDEIADGGSESHECGMARADIDKLVRDAKGGK